MRMENNVLVAIVGVSKNNYSDKLLVKCGVFHATRS